MKVTPTKRKFGRYAPGEEFELPDKVARAFISAKQLVQVGGLGYQTRALQAAPSIEMTIVPPSAQVSEATRLQIADASAESAAEVDSAGITWDAALHTSTKLKNADGTWRKKPGRAAG